MEPKRSTRSLVVADRAEPTGSLIQAMRRRTEVDDVQFRVVVPNPSRAELHLFHPERHDRAAEAERVLREALFALELVAGGRVLGSISVRHDPMDAVEDVLFNEPIDEIILSVATHGLSARLHQDLPHRLEHYGLPITVVTSDPEPN
jgi:hypothetical protein